MNILNKLLAPIPQALEYHDFADTRALLVCNNFNDVMSNVAFILIGLYFLYVAWNDMKKSKINNIVINNNNVKVLYNRYNIIFMVFNMTMILVGLGSAYYHYNPNNATLVWDRLPMAIGFSTLLYVVLRDSKVIHNKNIFVLLFAQIISIISVVYWAIYDDLRLYGLVQFGSIFIVVTILFYKYIRADKTDYDSYLLYAIILYIMAKVTEHYDHQIYYILPISGHTIKHLIAAWATYYSSLYIINIRNKYGKYYNNDYYDNCEKYN